MCTGRRRRSTRVASSSTCARSPSTTRPSGCSPSWRRSCWSPTWTASPTSSPPSMTSWTRTGRPSSGSSSALQVLLLVVVVYSTVRHPLVVTTAGHNRYGTGIWPGYYRMIIHKGRSIRPYYWQNILDIPSASMLQCCSFHHISLFFRHKCGTVEQQLAQLRPQPAQPAARPAHTRQPTAPSSSD